MYCKSFEDLTTATNILVLIVAKCIVNIEIEGDKVTFIPVLIVAKCIVNSIIRKGSKTLVLGINSSKVYCKWAKIYDI